MHELGIIEEMVKLAVHEIERAGATEPVTCITLTVGKLSGASPEALRTAFEIVSPQTRLRGADLVIHEPGAFCHCQECGRETEVDGYLFACPHCGSGSIVLEGGNQLQLASIDLDDEQGE